MITASEYADYLEQLNEITNESVGHLTRWLGSEEFLQEYTRNPDKAFTQALTNMRFMSDNYGAMSAELASHFFDFCQTREMGDLLNPANPAHPASAQQVAGVTRWAFDSTLKMDISAEDRVSVIKNKLTGSLTRLIRQPARGTILNSAGKAHVKFARVPQGTKTCQFCLMLASRGFVYATEESAGKFNQWHDHCDCMVVPGFGDNPKWPGYDPDALYEQYKAGTLGSDETLRKEHSKSVSGGMLSPLVDFDLYKAMNDEIKRNIIGTVAGDGLVVQSRSAHFMERLFGSVEMRRNGVELQSIVEALRNPLNRKQHGNSTVYYGKNVMVSVNPKTGRLIQVNPWKQK